VEPPLNGATEGGTPSCHRPGSDPDPPPFLQGLRPGADRHDQARKVLALHRFFVVALPPTWIGVILEFVGWEPARVGSVVRPLWVVGLIALAALSTDGRTDGTGPSGAR
jgi:hypothetical protein